MMRRRTKIHKKKATESSVDEEEEGMSISIEATTK